MDLRSHTSKLTGMEAWLTKSSMDLGAATKEKLRNGSLVTMVVEVALAEEVQAPITQMTAKFTSSRTSQSSTMLLLLLDQNTWQYVTTMDAGLRKMDGME